MHQLPAEDLQPEWNKGSKKESCESSLLDFCVMNDLASAETICPHRHSSDQYLPLAEKLFLG